MNEFADTLNASERIDRAKAKMLLAHPWWATLLLRLRVRESPSTTPTCATDGTYLYYRSEWIEGLTIDELVGVLMHEVAHCALMHPFRCGGRDPVRWNVAIDAAANALLLAAGVTLPDDHIPPAPLELTAEEIYELPEMEGFRAREDVIPASAGQSTNPTESPLDEREWRSILIAAHGLEPVGLARSIETAIQPKVDWREQLSTFILAKRRSNTRTWERPSRRVPGTPGWRYESESHIAVCIDTSGSIGQDELSAFAAECQAILTLSGMSAWIIAADAEVSAFVEPGEPFPTELGGGGGTDFRPAITKAESLDVQAIVYLTDGAGEYPSGSSLPVLWALTQHVPVPFGTAIYLEDIHD